MTTTAMNTEGIFQSVLVNYLVSQARTVEASVNRALVAVLERNERLASEVFLTEPRINEMEIVIDEHAIRLLRQGNLVDTDVRLIVATLKINNDLERMGDLAVNLSERAISLAAMRDVETPAELEPMTTAVRAMVSKCLGALIYQNVDLATQVLESDDVVDQYRDRVFDALLAGITSRTRLRPPRICSSCSLRGTSNASPTTPRISPRTFCSGCAASKCATGAHAQTEATAERFPAAAAVVIEFSHSTHRTFNDASSTLRICRDSLWQSAGLPGTGFDCSSGVRRPALEVPSPWFAYSTGAV